MRLFVAVWPPPEVVEVLAALERPAVDGVRWTAPAQWHVTLRFLGEVAEAAVPDVVASLSTAASGLSPVDVVVGERLEAFGPSVLHVPVDGLSAWATAVVDGFWHHEAAPGRRLVVPEAAGAGAERGPFVGHVTLARGRRGRGALRGDVRPLVGTPLPAGPRRWDADSFTLVRSHLGHAGARYETVATFVVGDHPHTNVRSQLR